MNRKELRNEWINEIQRGLRRKGFKGTGLTSIDQQLKFKSEDLKVGDRVINKKTFQIGKITKLVGEEAIVIGQGKIFIQNLELR